jgi:hypothetical protein
VVLPLSAIVWVFWARRYVPCENCGAQIKRHAKSCTVCGWKLLASNRRTDLGEPKGPVIFPGG